MKFESCAVYVFVFFSHLLTSKDCRNPDNIKVSFKKAIFLQLETSAVSDEGLPENAASQDDAKHGHVLAELLETEKIYVTELYSILKGYKMEAFSEEMQPILPPGFIEKLDIIFGNLEEIYAFHANVFLKDLENCISSVDLVALCFVQRVILHRHRTPAKQTNNYRISRGMLSINSTVTTARTYRDRSSCVRTLLRLPLSSRPAKRSSATNYLWRPTFSSLCRE